VENDLQLRGSYEKFVADFVRYLTKYHKVSHEVRRPVGILEVRCNLKIRSLHGGKDP